MSKHYIVSDNLVPEGNGSYSIGSGDFQFLNSWFSGTVSTSKLKITNGATAGYILISDDFGNASWTYSSVESKNYVYIDGNDNLFATFSGTTSTTGSLNVALGKYALVSNTTGVRNVALGSNSLYGNTTGNENLALGHEALISNINGNKNIAIGMHALGNATISSFNIAIGYYAVNGPMSATADDGFGNIVTNYGENNIGLGFRALYCNTNGNNNIAIGQNSLYTNKNGQHNIALGASSLECNISGDSNIALGRSSLENNTTGCYNFAMGRNSIRNNISGNYNIAIGRNSLYNATMSSHNIGIGFCAVNGPMSCYYSGYTYYGQHNIGLGYKTLKCNTNGSYNIAMGKEVLFHNTTGRYNVSLGYKSLEQNNSGNRNIAIGQFASRCNTTGKGNISLGTSALASNETGDENVALGQSSLCSNTQGKGNVAIGKKAGIDVTYGNYNTFVGHETAGLTYGGNISHTTIIGANVTLPPGITGSIYLSNGSGNVRLMSNSIGDVGIGTASPTAKLHIKGFDTNTGTYSLKVDDGDGRSMMYVRNDGSVGIGNVITSNTMLNYNGLHIKNDGSSYFSIGNTASGNTLIFGLEDGSFNYQLFQGGGYFYYGDDWNSTSVYSKYDTVNGNWLFGTKGLGSGNISAYNRSTNAKVTIVGSTNSSDTALEVVASQQVWTLFNTGKIAYYDWVYSENPLLYVKNNGYVGIGLTAPSTKLHIQSGETGAFRLVDGTEGPNYILVSDNDGVGTWKSASTINIVSKYYTSILMTASVAQTIPHNLDTQKIQISVWDEIVGDLVGFSANNRTDNSVDVTVTINGTYSIVVTG